MNTNAVAKLLGVSPSTIQRWVKQAKLKTNRNELGHYIFSEDNIAVLRKIQEQVNNGVLLQDIAAAAKKTRQAIVTTEIRQPNFEKLSVRISELEIRVDRKADDVVTYQLLQHRREIEELNDTIKALTERINTLEEASIKNNPSPTELVAAAKEQSTFLKRLKKKNLIGSLFTF